MDLEAQVLEITGELGEFDAETCVREIANCLAERGLDAMRHILQHNPQQRILILTVTDAEQVIEEVLVRGVSC
jgi:DNA-binding NarL/FixJ family response regulator